MSFTMAQSAPTVSLNDIILEHNGRTIPISERVSASAGASVIRVATVVDKIAIRAMLQERRDGTLSFVSGSGIGLPFEASVTWQPPEGWEIIVRVEWQPGNRNRIGNVGAAVRARGSRDLFVMPFPNFSVDSGILCLSQGLRTGDGYWTNMNAVSVLQASEKSIDIVQEGVFNSDWGKPDPVYEAWAKWSYNRESKVISQINTPGGVVGSDSMTYAIGNLTSWCQ